MDGRALYRQLFRLLISEMNFLRSFGPFSKVLSLSIASYIPALCYIVLSAGMLCAGVSARKSVRERGLKFCREEFEMEEIYSLASLTVIVLSE
jgi:hypothetical protein